MITSFTIIFSKDKNINELVKQTENFFGIKQKKINKKYTHGFDEINQYIVTLSPKQIEFILTNTESNLINHNLKKIKEFISCNFKNEILGLTYNNSICKQMLNNINEINIIDLQ